MVLPRSGKDPTESEPAANDSYELSVTTISSYVNGTAATFCWYKYDGAVLYFWNGELVGHGEVGFTAIVEALEKMDKHSVITVFSDRWTHAYNSPSAPISTAFFLPFSESKAELDKVVESRQLALRFVKAEIALRVTDDQ